MPIHHISCTNTQLQLFKFGSNRHTHTHTHTPYITVQPLFFYYLIVIYLHWIGHRTLIMDDHHGTDSNNRVFLTDRVTYVPMNLWPQCLLFVWTSWWLGVKVFCFFFTPPSFPLSVIKYCICWKPYPLNTIYTHQTVTQIHNVKNLKKGLLWIYLNFFFKLRILQ